ncbi:hypothetical protein Tco_1499657 [Tanacetum coccineum]
MHFCVKYNITANLRLELPGHDDMIRNSPEGKIGIYTRFIEFANFRLSLPKFLLSILEYYQINFSQLSVIAAVNISHFKILCRVHEGQPTVGTFRSPPSSEHVDTKLSYLKYASPAPHVQIEAVVVTVVPAHKADASSVLAHEAGTSFVPGPKAETLSSAPGDGSPANEFYDSQTIDSSTAKDIYIPNRDVTNDFRMDDVVICQNFFDHVPPPGYWTSLWNLTNAEFLDQFNANSAQHACMVLELRLRYEHEIEMRERFEKKFVMRFLALGWNLEEIHRGDGVVGIKRRRRDPSSDDIRDLVTASGRGRLNEDLESSTQQRRQEYNATSSQ